MRLNRAERRKSRLPNENKRRRTAGVAARNTAALLTALAGVSGIIFASPLTHLTSSRAAQRPVESLQITVNTQATRVNCGITGSGGGAALAVASSAVEVTTDLDQTLALASIAVADSPAVVPDQPDASAQVQPEDATPAADQLMVDPLAQAPIDTPAPDAAVIAPDQANSGLPDQTTVASDAAAVAPERVGSASAPTAVAAGCDPVAAASVQASNGAPVTMDGFFAYAADPSADLASASPSAAAIATETPAEQIQALPEVAGAQTFVEHPPASVGASNTTVIIYVTPSAAPRAVASALPSPWPTPVKARAAATPTPFVMLNALEQQIFSAQNAERARAGVAGLALDPTLESIGRRRAMEMASTGAFSHVSPSGGSVFGMMSAAGLSSRAEGENIAKNDYPGQQAATVAMNGFLNSSGHRQNLMDRAFTRVGIGVAQGAGGVTYFAVVFAGP